MGEEGGGSPQSGDPESAAGLPSWTGPAMAVPVVLLASAMIIHHVRGRQKP